jgi:HSP20 family protein
MNLVRWDPFSEFDTLFNRMAPRAFAGWPRLLPSGDDGNALEWSPTADISETDKEYLIRAALPAVKKEDVHVTVDSGMITIEGERKQRKEDKNEKLHRVETLYGSFTRSFSLPDDVDTNAIRCESSDGLLTVHIPKMKTTPSKPVEIKVQ